MEIIYIHQYFSLPTAAGGTRSYDLSRRLVKAGHKVVMITSSSFLTSLQPFSQRWTFIEYEGIDLHVLNMAYSNKMGFAKRVMAFIKFFTLSSLKVLKIKGDIVLATSTPITIAFPALLKKLIHNTPYIFEVRDVWPEVPIAMGIIKNRFIIRILKSFEKIIYRKAKHVVVLSEDMRHSVISRTNLPDNKITVIPNISEITRFSTFNRDIFLVKELIGFQPRKVVLYAGTLGMVNGLKYMVDMAIHSSAIDDTIVYLVLGDGMEKAFLVDYAKSAHVLNKNIFFLEPIPKSQLPQLYYECTVASSFVIPVKELWANSANKFFDCLAASRPIVINHLGWQAESIAEHNVGFVLHHDVARIEDEVRNFCQYINNDELLNEQQRNSGKLAVEKYSLEVAINNYLKVFNSVLS